ncbi:MAG: GNAT family N-acetyltransferase [Actinomycetota bacterium]|nr:GNAT family N-acetyltransferase [Actinomycetota bacterium]
MEELTVRPAAPDDAGDILGVSARAWRAGYAGLVPQAYLNAIDEHDEQRLSRLRVRLGDPAAGSTLLAVRRRVVLGFLSYGRERVDPRVPAPVFAAPGRAEVYALYVLPECWGTGLGSRLLADTLAALRAGGAGQVCLWVLRDNARARRCYERHGFALTGEEQQIDLGGPLPEVRYARGVEAGRHG